MTNNLKNITQDKSNAGEHIHYGHFSLKDDDKSQDIRTIVRSDSHDTCKDTLRRIRSDSSPTKMYTLYMSIPIRQPHNPNFFTRHMDQDEKLVKIVTIADTYNHYCNREFDRKIRQIQGDILIHAGNFSNGQTTSEIIDAIAWLCSLYNFKYKIFIAGNIDGIILDGVHPKDLQDKYKELNPRSKNVFYLENNMMNFLGINIYGCPYTSKHYGGFQYLPESQEARKLWEKIPHNCDILISHGPPAGIWDKTSKGEHIGCHVLRDAIEQRPSLKAIIFGHVHSSYGSTQIDKKWFINTSQYHGIFHYDKENQPYEIGIRCSDKKITSVNIISSQILD
ncbi:hypothetical protein I4U23_020713 [Adineta vaga]|nr:hypothetical protein I4U23_020713 [Adineta vaga]